MFDDTARVVLSFSALALAVSALLLQRQTSYPPRRLVLGWSAAACALWSVFEGVAALGLFTLAVRAWLSRASVMLTLVAFLVMQVTIRDAERT